MDIPNNLLPVRIKRIEHEIATYYVRAAPGVTLDQALDPSFWANFAWRFRIEDIVVVRAHDGEFRFEADVVAIDPERHWAKLRLLSLAVGGHVVADGNDDAGYRIERDPVQGYRILRDRDLVEKGLPSEEAARRRVAEFRERGEQPKQPVQPPQQRKVG